MRTHLLPRLGDTSVGRIDQRRVRRLITEMLGDGHGPATVRKVVGVLKLTLDLALEYGMIRKNRASASSCRRCPSRRCTT